MPVIPWPTCLAIPPLALACLLPCCCALASLPPRSALPHLPLTWRAGIESVLGYLKGSEAISTLGRKAPKLPTHEQLKMRTEALVNVSDHMCRGGLEFMGGGAEALVMSMHV